VSMDVTHSESVEKELDAFVERRHERRVAEEGRRPSQAKWRESERRREDGRRQLARLEWHQHHTQHASRLRATLEALIKHHENEAAKYEPDGAA
jgi:hypothetical protein